MKVDKFDYNRQKEVIINTIDELNDDYKITDGSFTNLFTEKYSDFKKGIDLLESELKKKDIDLFGFIKKYEDDVFKDQSFSDSAFKDVLLYTYDKNKGILSGLLLSDSDSVEYLIKYQYGYHNYDMGKKYILQSHDSLADYFSAVSENLLLGLIYSDYDSTELCNDFPIDNANALKIVDNTSVVKKYGDSYTICINLLALFTALSVTSNIYNINYNNFIHTIESDLKELNLIIKNDMLQIFIGEDEHQISNTELNKIKNLTDEKSSEYLIRYNSHKYNI